VYIAGEFDKLLKDAQKISEEITKNSNECDE
jgi:hypothetical protein